MRCVDFLDFVFFKSASLANFAADLVRICSGNERYGGSDLLATLVYIFAARVWQTLCKCTLGLALEYLTSIENKLGKKAKIKKLPLQLGDIKKTHSDISSLKKYTGYKPKTDIDDGINNFVNWYLKYYNIS